MKTLQSVFTTLIIIVFAFFIAFQLSFTSWHTKPQRSSTQGDIVKAKRLGVFVKELHSSVSSFDKPLNLQVYIEKGFKYGEYGDDGYDREDIEPLTKSYYPYSICVNRNPAEGVYIRMREDQQFKFESAEQYLEQPILRDTVIFEIVQYGNVSGELKVWN